MVASCVGDDAPTSSPTETRCALTTPSNGAVYIGIPVIDRAILVLTWACSRFACALSRVEVELSSVAWENGLRWTNSCWRLKSASACRSVACAPVSAACACSSFSL
jgi:hypothetical protein